MLIEVSEGRTFADVLGKLRKDVNPDVNEETVVSARTIQKDEVLILLDNKSNNSGFTVAKVKRVVGNLGKVKADPKKVTLEIRDLDPLDTEEEVVYYYLFILYTLPRTHPIGLCTLLHYILLIFLFGINCTYLSSYL